MQPLQKTADALRPQQPPVDLLHPSANIKLVITLALRSYHDQLPLTAAGYNAGPKSLNKWLADE